MGTTVSQMPSAHNRLSGTLNGASMVENLGPTPHQNAYVDGYSMHGEVQAPHQEQLDGQAEIHHASTSRLGVPAFLAATQLPTQGSTGYDRDELDAVSLVHQQEQRGVSNLSHAVSAVTPNGTPSRHTLAQASPTGGSTGSLNQASIISNPPGPSLTPGLEKRGPVEFNHAIGYVNKIKVNISEFITTIC